MELGHLDELFERLDQLFERLDQPHLPDAMKRVNPQLLTTIQGALG